MVNHYPEGHNIGLGMVRDSPEEAEIKRLEAKVAYLEAKLAEAQAKIETQSLRAVQAEDDTTAMRRLLEKAEAERDALQATLAKMRAAHLACTHRNVALQKIITEKQATLEQAREALTDAISRLEPDESGLQRAALEAGKEAGG